MILLFRHRATSTKPKPVTPPAPDVAAGGHLALGLSASSLRAYVLPDASARTRQLANPLAAKLGSGAGKYDDLTNWAAWVQDDWQAGVGRRAEQGGFLFGDADSRVPGQLILPPAVGQMHGWHWVESPPGGAGTTATLATAMEHSRLVVDKTPVSRTISAKAGQSIKHVWAYLDCSDNVSAVFQLLDPSGFVVASTKVRDASAWSAFRWVVARMAYTIPEDGNYVLRCFPEYRRSPLTIWFGDGEPLLGCDLAGRYCAGGIVRVLPGTDVTYAIGAGRAYGHDGGAIGVFEGGYFADIGYGATPTAYPATPVDAIIYADRLWIAHGEQAPAASIDLLSGYAVQLPFFCSHWARWNGYLWAAFRNVVIWSADGVEWSEPIEVGPADYEVRSIAGVDDAVHVATDDGLYVISASDDVVGRVSWGSVHESNGRAMVHYQGRLYALVNDRIVQIDSGTLLDISMSSTLVHSGPAQQEQVWSGRRLITASSVEPNSVIITGDVIIAANVEVRIVSTGGRQNNLLANFQVWTQTETIGVDRDEVNHIVIAGDVTIGSGVLLRVQSPSVPVELGPLVDLCPLNNWLLALRNGAGLDDPATIWAWQTEGWHCVAVLPPDRYRNLSYDRRLGRLWVTSKSGVPVWLPYPDQTVNPAYAPGYMFAANAWLESDWFDGGLIEVYKDCESVFVSGDLPAGTAVDVYWMDDQSADWELLGEITPALRELRWSDAATRPSTKRLRLALQLRTTDPYVTPVVNAVRLKYMPMVQDRWRWQLSLQCEDGQEMLDGSINEYSAQQQLAHLAELALATAPVRLRDIDGAEYDVKVLAMAERATDFAFYHGALHSAYNVQLSLEQCNPANG